MHGLLPIFFLLVVLKIPVLGSLWLVWWAAQEPKPDEEASPGSDDGFGRRPPIRPRPRGPHGAPQAPRLRRGEEAGVQSEPRRPVPHRARHQALDGSDGGPSGGTCEPEGRVPQDGHPSPSHTA